MVSPVTFPGKQNIFLGKFLNLERLNPNLGGGKVGGGNFTPHLVFP